MSQMQSTGEGYSDEDFARRGDEIYEREVRPRVGPQDEGKFVAIDIETGAYEVDADARVAMDRLAVRCPGAEAWLTRVGRGYAHRYGGGHGRVERLAAR